MAVRPNPEEGDVENGPAVLERWTAGPQHFGDSLYGAYAFTYSGGRWRRVDTADFRDQGIPAGTYILRYSQQPVDGAHVGTSTTRDFLALLPAWF